MPRIQILQCNQFTTTFPLYTFSTALFRVEKCIHSCFMFWEIELHLFARKVPGLLLVPVYRTVDNYRMNTIFRPLRWTLFHVQDWAVTLSFWILSDNSGEFKPKNPDRTQVGSNHICGISDFPDADYQSRGWADWCTPDCWLKMRHWIRWMNPVLPEIAAELLSFYRDQSWNKFIKNKCFVTGYFCITLSVADQRSKHRRDHACALIVRIQTDWLRHQTMYCKLRIHFVS